MRTAILLLAALALPACTNPDVPAGHEGYVYHRPLWFGKMEYRESLRGPASTAVSASNSSPNISNCAAFL